MREIITSPLAAWPAWSRTPAELRTQSGAHPFAIEHGPLLLDLARDFERPVALLALASASPIASKVIADLHPQFPDLYPAIDLQKTRIPLIAIAEVDHLHALRFMQRTHLLGAIDATPPDVLRVLVGPDQGPPFLLSIQRPRAA